MNQFHMPADEKRMVAILPPDRYQEWLEAERHIQDFMQPFDSEQLIALLPNAPAASGLVHA